MNIIAATQDYEAWLAEQTHVHAPELDYKHALMADKKDPFPFFRGTYYRWAKQWHQAGEPWNDAPVVLAIGDAHLENFGTWRDSDGRLIWGVNDFDEADYLPYTQDLARLAASICLAKPAADLRIGKSRVCRAILRGYHRQLATSATPFVLEEHHSELRALAMASERDPKQFWKRLTRVLDEPLGKPPAEARELLLRGMPSERLVVQFRFHRRVGMGSLGKPRYVALAQWQGGWIAREAKAATPPSTAWSEGRRRREKPLVDAALRVAVRCPDPLFFPGLRWNVRRLAPRCSRIELDLLQNAEHFERLTEAMGAEIANVHAGSSKVTREILNDLKRRSTNWLAKAVRATVKNVLKDWSAWSTAYRAASRRRSRIP